MSSHARLEALVIQTKRLRVMTKLLMATCRYNVPVVSPKKTKKWKKTKMEQCRQMSGIKKGNGRNGKERASIIKKSIVGVSDSDYTN